MNIMKKIQADENGCKYILFRTDINFSKCFLAIEIDEKGHTDRDINFEEKRQEALEKKLGCEFIRINISNGKNGYDLDYEMHKNLLMSSQKKEIKKLEKQLIKEKEMREKLEREMREKVENEMREKLEEELKDKNKELKNLSTTKLLIILEKQK